MTGRTAARRRLCSRWGHPLLACFVGLAWAVACGRTSQNAARRDAAPDAAAGDGATPRESAAEDASGDVTLDAPPDARRDGDAAPESGADVEAGIDAGCDADLMSDPANCGACGAVCCAGSMCLSGSCSACSGPPGTVCCPVDAGPPDGCVSSSAIEVDPLVDPCHCGDCSTACKAGTACVSGQCIAVDGGTGCQQP